MKIGDLVRYKKDGPTIARHVGNNAIIIEMDDSHRQTVVTLLMDNGNFVERVWDAQLEVISDS
jgi:hypothetical protein